MPNPTLSDVHVNRPLTNISIAYMQNANAFVADKVFPRVPVVFRSDSYYKYVRADWNRNEMQERAPSTESSGGGFKFTTDSYSCKVYSTHKDVDDQIRANSDTVLAPDTDATNYVTHQSLLNREVSWAAKYFAASIWGTEKAGQATADSTHVVFWNRAAATPIEDVAAAATAVQLSSGGFRPNTLVLGRQTYDALKNHPEFVDRIKYGQTPGRIAQVTLDGMASLFEVERVMVMDAVQNTAIEGATEANAFIGGKHALLCYSAPSPALMTPSAGYTFIWSGLVGAEDGVRIKSFRMEHLSSDRIEIDSSYDQKLVGSDLGYFFNLVVE